MDRFVPVGPRRTFEGAVEQIAEAIRLGELNEGDRLPAERELATAMQISRATLREAVRVLSDAKVLTVKPGSSGGIYVASGYVPFELLRSKSKLRLGEVAGVLEARRLFEPRVAQLASLNARDNDFIRLQANIDQQKALVDAGDVTQEIDRFLQLDAQFHLSIASATGNATIVSLMRMLLRQLEIARDMALHLPPIPGWVIEIHERTLAAIRSTDQQEIEVVMDEHLAAMERNWERETGRVLVRPIPEFLRPVAERAVAEHVSQPGNGLNAVERTWFQDEQQPYPEAGAAAGNGASGGESPPAAPGRKTASD
jgi:GntR family transcriptional regulator, transcriptional repressor for pyruvate dehydrogenase complex